MGKQRRKQKRGSKGSSSSNSRTPNSSGQEYNPNSAISRIRHPDHKIRYEALVALQSALLIHSGKSVNMQVLQAVREQILDPNFDCQIAAVQCLENYLISLPEAEESYKNERRDEMTSSWLLILIERLKKCMEAIEEGRDAKLWFAVCVPCLRLFCRLCEANEKALEQVNLKKMDFAILMPSFINIYAEKFSGAAVDGSIKKNAEDAAVLAARCMHSAVDDNPELAAVLDESLHKLAMKLQESPEIPQLAVLHFVGCLATVSGMVHSGKCKTLLPSYLNAIQEKFMSFDEMKAESLDNNFHEAKEVWKKQLVDDELEKQVVQEVTDRHEPARQIARRQKEDTREHNSHLDQQEDGKALLQRATEEWNSFLAPLHLVLEILTNMTASLIPDTNGESMDIESDFDSETEMFLRKALGNVHRPIPDLLSACVAFKRSHQDKCQLIDGIEDLISKISAFAANCVQSDLLSQNDVTLPTALFNLLIKDENLYAEPGVASVLAVLTDHDENVRHLLLSEPGLLDRALRMLLETGRDPIFLRDMVCMLINTLRQTSSPLPKEMVGKIVSGMIQLLSQGADPSVGYEILNGFMDIFADDEINNDIFLQLNILEVFKRSLSSLDDGMTKDEEVEEILENSKRFVEYKQSMM
jgi:hypothetical protein